MGQTIEHLRAEIEKLRKKSVPDGRYFVSPKDLKDFLTKTTIQKAIAIQEFNVPDFQQPTIAERIFKEGQILFGILIWRKWQRKLMSFVENNTLDSQLPIDVKRAEEIADPFGSEFARHAQWEFLPRMLEKEMSGYHCHFKEEEILPFLDEKWLGDGAFGDVTKVSVLPSLQTMFPQSTPEVFLVRKKLRNTVSNSRGTYMEREKECLLILDRLRHPNIVQLLGSYTYRDNLYFLFPLLRIDLKAFLQLEMDAGNDYFRNDFQFYTALQGLSSAIETVHSLRLSTSDHEQELTRIGYHHDIRPANVLVDSRTFYLADFGLARMKPGDENSQTKWKTGLGDYVAPECIDENLMHREVGRPLDIWSFGCMLSEIATYIHGGPSSVKTFQEQRFGQGYLPNMTNHFFFSGDSLRVSVMLWFQNLKEQSESVVLRNLLETATLMLAINPKERPKATEVHQRLSFLSVKALFDAVQKRWLEEALRQGPTSSTTWQLEYCRFVAWGKVLQLTGDDKPSTNITAAVCDKGNIFRYTLTSLFEKLDPDVRQHDQMKPPSAMAFPIRKPHEELVQEFITNLRDALPISQQEKMRQLWLEAALAANSSVQEALDGPSSQLGHYSELGDLVSTKAENLRLKGNKLLPVPEFNVSGDKSLLLASDALHIGKSFESDQGLTIARYRDQQVLVEWVSRTEKWIAMSEPQKLQRIQVMAEVFHRGSNSGGFRTLNCIGFVWLGSSEEKEFGFVYAFPMSTNPECKTTTMPISLSQILKSRSKSDLPLEERFKLAHKLVSSVRELHLVGWLHKNINSRNIIFFGVEGGNSAALSDILTNPYLINFRYSRPSEEACQSERPEAATASGSNALTHYQHPDYTTTGEHHFRETYDYYSVGIILLELGSWATLETFLDRNPRLESDPAVFRDTLIMKYAPRLRHLMGTTYTAVTTACLRCDFGLGEERSSLGGEERQTALGDFHDKVVTPLSELSRCPI
ncbi:kinase-like domain-containing protein [Trichophaea hybrida]|nr:kinase-like domain-containing protein [Trichophaea hybrida]